MTVTSLCQDNVALYRYFFLCFFFVFLGVQIVERGHGYVAEVSSLGQVLIGGNLQAQEECTLLVLGDPCSDAKMVCVSGATEMTRPTKVSDICPCDVHQCATNVTPLGRR